MSKKIKRTRRKKTTSNLRHFFYMLLISLLFLTYPGDSVYVKLFSQNKPLFANNSSSYALEATHPVPFVINSFYQPDISAGGGYVIDIDSATPVYQKNLHTRFLPASTTKIITALTAYDYFDLEDVLTTKRDKVEGQAVGIVLGEKLTFENTLYGLLIHSGNDMAYLIADNYPGGEAAFVTKMNQKVSELGMKETHFDNPAGYDRDSQLTSPFDLSLAGRSLLENRELSRIVSTRNITISDTDFKYFHNLSNVNKLLGEVPGIGGLKTGYTEEAGENLVTFYKKDGHRFLIVILKSADRFEDTKKIVEWINGNVSFIEINSKP